MTIEQLAKQAKNPALAKILIKEKLGLDDKSFFLKKNKKLTKNQLNSLQTGLERLGRDEPVQYICKNAYFHSLKLYVNKNVLIPRPETELIIEKARLFLDKIPSKKKLNIVDIGTGSGCIAICLAKETANRKDNILATDISQSALIVAKQNAKKHKAKINFLKSNLLSSNKLPKRFDLIIANLPYLKSDYLNTLDYENHSIKYEPGIALDGGRDGLAVVKKLIDQLPSRLEDGAKAILEVGDDQKSELKRYSGKFRELKFTYLNDLTGRFRFVLIDKLT